jgi:selenocysteine lyase/cysteine desulfurase
VPDWEAIRAEFNTRPENINMAAFYLASHPKPVREAIDQHRRLLDACPITDIDDNMRLYEADTRSAIVAYFGGTENDYAVTGSTTMGLGTVYCGLNFRASDEVLSTIHDHYSTSSSLRFASERAGFSLRNISLYADSASATLEEILTSLRSNIRPETRLIAITWVHSSTGVKLPISKISMMVKKINEQRHADNHLMLAVDGVHGFGIENTTIEELGCDFFISGCHKWIFGPRGTGLIYGTPAAWAITSPTIPSFDAIWRGDAEARTPAAMMTPGGFHAFEHMWALRAAFQMHLRIGKQNVYERTLKLNQDLKEALVRMPHVRLYTPLAKELSAGMVCFDVVGLEPAKVVAKLRSMNVIASQTPYNTSYARVSASLLNNDSDIERTISAIRKVGN